MAKVLMNLADVTVTLGGWVIFDRLNFEVQAGQRIGLVGPNGAGKSTLMKLMAQELAQDEGELFRASGLTCARLEQEPSTEDDRTVFEEASTARPEMAALERRLHELEAAMAEPEAFNDYAQLEQILNKHARLLEEYERLEGHRYQGRVKKALTSLGIGEETWERPMKLLSGGQKKLALLAKLLVLEPQLLLLDEPDNHLDISAKEDLEKIVRGYPGCVVIISHDRYLLDEVATHIAELENGKLTLYPGNYSAYKTERELRRLRQQQLLAAQQKEIARIEAAIARFEQWASIVVDERHIRQARSRRKMLDKMERVDKVVDQRRMRMELEGWRGSNKVLELREVNLTLPGGVQLWRGLNDTLWHGDRVGLVGPNGAGKSMLLRQILSPESLERGEIRLGPSIKIGYYAQEHETLDLDSTPLAELRGALPISEGAAVAYLNKFLFSYAQIRGRVGDLSGGERSRLQLAKLVSLKPNLLLLDEPTNNLDIASIEVLEQALEEFVGTALIVSRDRYFLDNVVDRVLELRAGRLTEYVGGYTDYLAMAGQVA